MYCTIDWRIWGHCIFLISIIGYLIIHYSLLWKFSEIEFRNCSKLNMKWWYKYSTARSISLARKSCSMQNYIYLPIKTFEASETFGRQLKLFRYTDEGYVLCINLEMHVVFIEEINIILYRTGVTFQSYFSILWNF